MKRYIAILFSLILIFNSTLIVADIKERELPLSFDFLDASDGDKWGDCTLISFPNGENMLIDTGIEDVADNVISILKEKGIKKIDYFVLSHLHADHYGGMKKIIETFPVERIYSNFYAPPEQRWIGEYLLDIGIPYERLTSGDSIVIDEVIIDVLWPRAKDVEVLPEQSHNIDSVVLDVNNHSLVMRFSYAGKMALFTGDIYKSAEKDLLSFVGAQALKADLLKIMHHGHSTSGDAEFLDAVNPQYAVMMGNIVMTLPVYKRYVERECWPYATWMNGTVTIDFYKDRIEKSASKSLKINDFYKKLEIKYPGP